MGLFLFIALALVVAQGQTRAIDENILKWVRALASRNDQAGRLWAEESVIALTSLGAVVVLVGASGTVLGLLLLAREWQSSVVLSLALLGAIGLNQSLKPLFDRKRPEIVRRIQPVNTPSFPSGHALMSTAVYMTLAMIGARLLRDRRAQIYLVSVAALITLLIGLSRIYLGVHYPSDVLAGWILGSVWALLCGLAKDGVKRSSYREERQ